MYECIEWRIRRHLASKDLINSESKIRIIWSTGSIRKIVPKNIDVAGNLTFFCDILIIEINCLKANNYVGYTLICLLNCIEIIV